MTVDAGRDDMGLLLPEFAIDDLAVDFLDLSVTLLTRAGDVFLRDTRSPIGVREDEMSRMTRGADRSNCQPFFEEADAVNRVDVVLQDSFLRDVALHRNW